MVIILGLIAVGLYLVMTGASLTKLASDIQLFFAGKPQEKCKKGEFYCEGAESNIKCIEFGTSGQEGSNCDPRNYVPVNYEPGRQDICREDCKIHICKSTGTGRVGSKCQECQGIGDSCEGGVPFIGGSKRCCAQEFVECRHPTLPVIGGIGFLQGTCELK